MKVLKRFTLKDIKLNRKRSIVTIIAIILSTALICTVATMFASLMKSSAESIIKTEGLYHVNILNADKDLYDKLKNNSEIESVHVIKDLGTDFEYGEGENFNPVSYLELDDKAFENMYVKISEGRLPKNNTEIVITKRTNIAKRNKYKIGDTYKVKLQDDIHEADPDGEPKTIVKTYTIVGIADEYGFQLGMFNNCLAFSHLDDYSEKYEIGVVYKNIRRTYKATKELLKGTDYSGDYNVQLLQYSGVASTDRTQDVLYSVLYIVVGIVIACSVFVIRNSFTISITEKKKELGILTCVGSTKKQIRSIVIREGLYLGVIGIPLGIGLGVFASWCLCAFTNAYLGEDLLGNMSFILDIPWPVIILTIIGALITIILSSLGSALKASRISPIEAVRSNDDIKINKKKIKTSKLTKKLLGIGGVIAAKNLKRSKKKYRSTVISLIVSITIFVSLSYFLMAFKGVFNDLYKNVGFDMEIHRYDDSATEDEKFINQFKAPGYYDKYVPYVHAMAMDREGTISKDMNIEVTFYDDDIFDEYLKELKINDADAHKKLIYVSGNKKKIDKVSLVEPLNSETITKEVMKTTDVLPFGYIDYGEHGFLVGSIDLSKEYHALFTGNIYIKTEDTEKYIEYIEKLNLSNFGYSDISSEARNLNRLITWMSVFLYGFIIVISLIGVTNVFNTITTNMNLRSKEFAMLKSIGMTKKEFNRMIFLESMIYGLKSFFFGSIIGCILSYLIWTRLTSLEAIDIPFELPYIPLAISFAFIMVVVGLIMKYSLSKINKQNIIETIRNDNI